MEPLQPADPRTVGRYRVSARLGRGGMGEVYLGYSPGGRAVAVKVVRPELAADAEFRRRFTQEVQAARLVGGFHTAPVVDADVECLHPYLVTAYVPGPSLATVLGEHGPLPAASVRVLGAGLAEALEAIHSAGLIHRDLKPANILLAADGPRVIDFGISRALDATALTRAGTSVGTPGFMAPEQITGAEVTPAADVFALGAVLCEAYGVQPYGEGSPNALMYRIVHQTPDVTALPDDLRDIVAPCLAKDPADRPTAADLLARLETDGPTIGWLPASVAHLITDAPAAEAYTAVVPPGSSGNTKTLDSPVPVAPIGGGGTADGGADGEPGGRPGDRVGGGARGEHRAGGGTDVSGARGVRPGEAAGVWELIGAELLAGVTDPSAPTQGRPGTSVTAAGPGEAPHPGLLVRGAGLLGLLSVALWTMGWVRLGQHTVPAGPSALVVRDAPFVTWDIAFGVVTGQGAPVPLVAGPLWETDLAMMLLGLTHLPFFLLLVAAFGMLGKPRPATWAAMLTGSLPAWAAGSALVLATEWEYGGDLPALWWEMSAYLCATATAALAAGGVIRPSPEPRRYVAFTRTILLLTALAGSTAATTFDGLLSAPLAIAAILLVLAAAYAIPPALGAPMLFAYTLALGHLLVLTLITTPDTPGPHFSVTTLSLTTALALLSAIALAAGAVKDEVRDVVT